MKNTRRILKKLLEWKSDIIKTNNEALYNGSLDDNSVSADIVDQASSYTDKNVEMKAIVRQIKLIAKIESALKKIKMELTVSVKKLESQLVSKD